MATASCGPILTIQDGIHAAAIVSIPRGETSVGSALSGAVVVTDMPVDIAFVLKWDGRRLGFRAVDCDAAIAGDRQRSGTSRILRRSTQFTSGGIKFQLDFSSGKPGITGAFGSWPILFSSRPAGFAAGLLMASIAALVAGSTWPPRPTPTLSLLSPGVPTPLTQPPPARHHATDLPDQIRKHLTAVHLDEIAIEPQPDGAIVAVGRVAPNRGDSWRDVVRWFDTAAEGRAVLIDRVTVAQATAPVLQIRAVYLGQTPYVIDGSGEKFLVGSVMADGSVLRNIDGRRLLLERGGQTLAVRF